MEVAVSKNHFVPRWSHDSKEGADGVERIEEHSQDRNCIPCGSWMDPKTLLCVPLQGPSLTVPKWIPVIRRQEDTYCWSCVTTAHLCRLSPLFPNTLPNAFFKCIPWQCSLHQQWLYAFFSFGIGTLGTFRASRCIVSVSLMQTWWPSFLIQDGLGRRFFVPTSCLAKTIGGGESPIARAKVVSLLLKDRLGKYPLRNTEYVLRSNY